MLTAPPAHPLAQAKIDAFHPDVVAQVQKAITEHPVVVIGMAWNPNCSRAIRAFEGSGHTAHYVEFGSYLSGWRERLALKMWSNWPTFPQVYVRGQLIGGADQAQEAVKSGEVARLLGAA